MMNLITNDRLVLQYGDRHDEIYVYKGDKRVGFLSDLRQQFIKDMKEPSGGGFGWKKPQRPVRRHGANSFGPGTENKF